MPLVKKTIFGFAKKSSPDADVVVTPARRKHWQEQFQRLSAANYRVPADWGHGNSESDLKPVKDAEFEKRRRSSGMLSVGKLASFEVAPDGGSVEIALDIPDEEIAKRAAANLFSVSPVITKKLIDSDGNVYEDVITHVDLVSYPVDNSQGPFVPADAGAVACSVRMGLEVIRMAAEDEEDKADDKDTSGAAAEDQPAPENPDMPQDTEPDAQLSAVIAQLAALPCPLVLPSDTTREDLIPHLLTALKTANAHAAKADQEEDEGEDDPPLSAEVAKSPDFAAMSLDPVTRFAENLHRERIGERLDSLLKQGKCTPAEIKEQRKLLGTVRLSLDSAGKPQASSVEQFIAHRESVPPGTFFDTAQRTRMSTDVAAPLPEGMGDGESDEEAAKKLEEFHRLAGVAPRKKK